MRITLDIYLVASFLTYSAVDVLAAPGLGLKHASTNLHRRAWRALDHPRHQKRLQDDVLLSPLTPRRLAPAGSEGPPDSGFQMTSTKKHKKRSKNKCALKQKGNGSSNQALLGDGTQGDGKKDSGSRTPAPGSQGWQGGDFKPTSGATQEQSSQGDEKPSFGAASVYDDRGKGEQDQLAKPGAGSQSHPMQPTAGKAESPYQNGKGNNVGNQGQNQEDSDAHQGGPGPANDGNPTPIGPTDQDGIHCKGMRGSTVLPTGGKNQYQWFDPTLIYHGPATFFGGGGDFWQGGACMFNDLPHKNLPSVAMDETYFQDGLACGSCVEIAPTSASLFSNDAKWSVEAPRRGELPPGKKTIAIVSDRCPGVNQCWSGLDLHPDTWNSVTNGASPTKLPISWRFVNCKEAFESPGSGVKHLQVHWREGANPGFFQVQIRGNHETVVKVEMKLGRRGWVAGTHVDFSWWKWDTKDTDGCGVHTPVAFRITDWQGQTITSEVSTVMNKDLFFEANFDRTESASA